jgi:translation elongation factor EF-1alpha
MAEAKEKTKEKKIKEKKIGVVEHYFGKIGVAAIKMKSTMSVGDTIHIKGHTTDFEQAVDSIQIEHESVQKVKKGDDIGIKVKDHVREGDEVFIK